MRPLHAEAVVASARNVTAIRRAFGTFRTRGDGFRAAAQVLLSDVGESAPGDASLSMQLTELPNAHAARFDAKLFERNSGTVLMLCGELDLAVSQPLETIAMRALENSEKPAFYVDVSGLSFCGSQGLSLFVRLDQTARRLGHEFVLRGATPALVRLLEITSLDTQLALEG